MNVALCSAADVLESKREIFKDVVNELGLISVDFVDPVKGQNNYDSDVEASIKIIELAHIVVFVLIEKSGEITWNTEFIETINSGKPFILLVHNQLQTAYFKHWVLNTNGYSDDHPFYRAFKTLDLLRSRGISIISFNSNQEFRTTLKMLILNEIEQGLVALQEKNKKKSTVGNILKPTYKTYFLERKPSAEENYYLEILFDQFQNKEVRKRLIYYFSIHKGLTDDQIIDLLNDSEQGISRMAAEKLPDLVNSTNNIPYIVDELIDFADQSGEVGIIRRSIAVAFSMDTKFTTKKIMSLFPAADIGTPKRILKWLINNPENIKQHMGDANFNSDLDAILNYTKSYSDEEKLPKLVEVLEKMVSAMRSENLGQI